MILGISVLVFGMLYMVPGDPVYVYLGDRPASPERVESLRRQLGLDQPAPVQYARFAANALRGDLGRDMRSGRPVRDMVAEALPSTVQLTLAALAIAALLGVTLGVVAALFRGTWIDTGAMLVALLGVSMPVFWLGLLLILVFSLRLGWLPATGQGGLERLVLPATCLGFLSAAVLARLVRSSMLEVLHKEYITTARAKGLNSFAIVTGHALKNALIPAVTMLGLQIGGLLGGAVITETIFSRPGLGRLAVDAILNKDFPVVQGTVLTAAVFYVLVNLIVDISYAWLDPRIRFGA